MAQPTDLPSFLAYLIALALGAAPGKRTAHPNAIVKLHAPMRAVTVPEADGEPFTIAYVDDREEAELIAALSPDVVGGMVEVVETAIVMLDAHGHSEECEPACFCGRDALDAALARLTACVEGR